MFVVRPGGGIAEMLMVPLMVVEVHPLCDLLTQFFQVGIAIEPTLFVFQTPPKPLDEDVVNPATFPVYADFNLVFLQLPDPFLNCK